jgi:membrane dipeptidase
MVSPLGDTNPTPARLGGLTPKPLIIPHTGLDTRTGSNPRVWTKMADSLKDFVENIKAMIDAIGIDHVGIGSDTDLLSPCAGQGTNAPEEIKS